MPEKEWKGADDWFIDVMLELFRITRSGYGSQTTTAVEHIIGRKPIPFAQFAKDYDHIEAASVVLVLLTKSDYTTGFKWVIC